MNLKEYQAKAVETESLIETLEVNKIAWENTLKVFVAAGNILDQIKKNAFYGKAFDYDHITDCLHAIEDATEELSWISESGLSSSKVDITDRTRLFHSIIGIATESTELVESLTNESIDTVNILEEFGDLSWYQAIGIDTLMADWEQVLDVNIEKLQKKRYKSKTFTADEAINRDTDEERESLESLS